MRVENCSIIALNEQQPLTKEEPVSESFYERIAAIFSKLICRCGSEDNKETEIKITPRPRVFVNNGMVEEEEETPQPPVYCPTVYSL